MSAIEHTKRYAWDAASWKVQEQFAYDAYGNVKTRTDSLNRSETTLYDATYNALPIIVSRSGMNTRFVYNSLLQLESQIDVNGQTVSSLSYDKLSRIVKLVTPDTTSDTPKELRTYENLQIDGLNSVCVKTTYADNTYTRQCVDGFGRTIREQMVVDSYNGDFVVQNVDTRYAYEKDNASQGAKRAVTKQSAPVRMVDLNNGTFATMDGAVLFGSYASAKTYFTDEGFVTEQTSLDGKTGKSISAPYMKKDIPVGFTTPASITYTNGSGEVTKTEQYNLGSTTPYAWYTYAYTTTAQGMTVSKTDQDGKSAVMTYDMLGRQTAVSDVDMGNWSYVYDDIGNIVSSTNAKNETTTYTYDALDRVTGVNYPGTTPDVTYTYDQVRSGYANIGKLTSVSVAGGISDVYNYDANGRMTSVNRTIDGKSKTMQYVYDKLDRVITTIYPDGEQVNTTYRYGRPNTVAGTSTYISGISYRPFGGVEQINYGNGTNVAYTYKEAEKSYLLDTMRVNNTGTGANVGLNQGYAFDNQNRLSSIDDKVSDGNDQNFGYDAFSRLNGVTYPSAAGKNQSFAYNAADNMVTASGKTYTYADAAHPHAPTGDGLFSYTYDANGNMISRTKPAPASSNRQFVYDAVNRLVSVSDNGQVIMNASYDAGGQRVKKVEGTTTTYYFFPQYEEVYNGPVATTTPVINKYYYLAGLYTPVAWKNGATLYYVYADQQGSVVRVANSAGQQVGSASYAAYGDILEQSGTLPERKYTGQIYDNSTGLYYYNARYYDSKLTRFITADTLTPGGSTNRYAYAFNSPMMYTDPDGHNPLVVVLVVGLVLVATGGLTYGISTMKGNHDGQVAGLIIGGVGLAAMGFVVGSAAVAGTANMTIAQTIALGVVGGALDGAGQSLFTYNVRCDRRSD